MTYYVYILANARNTTVYTGVTNDLIRRVYEHKHEADGQSFTARYKIHKLVYYESTPDVRAAIEREKQIKGWNRSRKNKLIESRNPQWDDLYNSILSQAGVEMPEFPCHCEERSDAAISQQAAANSPKLPVFKMCYFLHQTGK